MVEKREGIKKLLTVNAVGLSTSSLQMKPSSSSKAQSPLLDLRKKSSMGIMGLGILEPQQKNSK